MRSWSESNDRRVAELRDQHQCKDRDLEPVEHKANTVDWSQAGSTQSYQVYRCRVCADYWGVRHQYDAGTGSDDRSRRFGPDLISVVRHY